MFDFDSMSEGVSGNKFFHRKGIQSVMIQSAQEKQNQEQQELQALLAKFQGMDMNQQQNEDEEPFVLEDDDLPMVNSNNNLTLPNTNSKASGNQMAN